MKNAPQQVAQKARRKFMMAQEVEEVSPLWEVSPPKEKRDIVERPEDDETETKTTSLGAELYAKKLGLIALAACSVIRFFIDVHVNNPVVSSSWRTHALMGVSVSAVWFYGMLRHDKRSTDGWVNALLIVWSILLFF